MKILYLITSADLGGAQRYVLILAKHFKGIIAAGIEHKNLFIEAEKLGIQTFKLKHVQRKINLFADLFAIFEIRKLIKQIQPDIVHLNSSKMGFLGSIAGKLAGCKVVYTAHGFAFSEDKGKIWKSIIIAAEKISGKLRDFMITVSYSDEKAAYKFRLMKSIQIKTIHNGITQLDFLDKYQAREELGLPQDKIIIGTISNLYLNKGLDILIQSAKEISDKKLVFAIIGDGPEKIKLQNQITKYNLTKRILFLGPINQAANYLKAFDIFVLCSRKEGFPFVLLEALQAGLPIIATDVGGNNELLSNVGIMIESNNPEKLTEAILKILGDKNMALGLSQKAWVHSRIFTEEKMCNETKEVYEKLKQ